MNALDGYWAKSRNHPSDPHGEPLTEHLLAAWEEAGRLQRRTGRISVLPARFWDWVRIAALNHDDGKIPQGFQKMVGNPGPATPWGQRHEVYSLGFVTHVLASLPAHERDWIAAAVATHHRPITGGRSLRGELNQRYPTPRQLAEAFAPVDLDAAHALIDWLRTRLSLPPGPMPSLEGLAEEAHKSLTGLIDYWEDPDDDELRNLTAVLLQGAVTLADHVASAHSEILLEQPLNVAYPPALAARLAAKEQVLFPHQAGAAAADGHLLLRAPTGRGKTEALLLWGAGQTEALAHATGGAPRVFYMLPYLASINAMAGRLGPEVGDPDGDLIGVAHSKSAGYYLERAADDDCGHSGDGPDEAQIVEARRATARAAATRLFREPIRVGTPYQLLRGALAGPAYSGTLIDTANSVFLLDELHAYDPRRLGMILAMMRLWVRLGGGIGVASATLPDALARLLTDAVGGDLHQVQPATDDAWPTRHRLRIRTGHLTGQPIIDEITRRLRGGESVLVVANNVADALTMYEQLAPIATNGHSEDRALLLHSRFRAMDRAAIEERILGRYAAGGPRRPGLLVATQTVEVSLNIDFDTLYTSGSQLEPLIQRFGRVNRLGTLLEPADVVVCEPSYGPRRGRTTEYADGVYDAEPVRLAWDILTRHDGTVLDERIFGDWLNDIYDSTNWGATWAEEVADHEHTFSDTFLRFRSPFNDRSNLAEKFDELFEGTEAVLIEDLPEYQRLLESAATVGKGSPAAGRLLASRLMIPLPEYAAPRSTWNPQLKINTIDGEYDPHFGLQKIHRRQPSDPEYRLGEVL